MFARYHYLSHTHHKGAKVFLLLVNDTIAGFCSVLHFPHPKVTNLKIIHRLVIMPDFQGIGIGKFFLSFIGNFYKQQNFRVIITTSSPALLISLKNSSDFKLTRQGRVSKSLSATIPGIVASLKRVTTSWEYCGK